VANVKGYSYTNKKGKRVTVRAHTRKITGGNPGVRIRGVKGQSLGFLRHTKSHGGFSGVVKNYGTTYHVEVKPARGGWGIWVDGHLQDIHKTRPQAKRAVREGFDG
jgi:hypothetical protein